MSITVRTSRWFGLALSESSRSTYERVRIGSVLVQGNKLVSSGANLCTSHPMQQFWNEKAGRVSPRHNLHSEMHALVQAKRKGISLKGADIYIARFDRRGRLAHCKPCKACAAALLFAGIRFATYSTPEGIVTHRIN